MKRFQISGVDIFFLTLIFVIFIAIILAPNILIGGSNDNIKKVSNQIESRRNIANISSDLVINTDLTTLSQELITTPKEANNNLDYNILLVLLSLTTLLSIFVSFWLYRWRKIVISGNEIVVPETFFQHIQEIVLAVKNSSSELGSVMNQQSNAVNKSSISLDSLNENIKEMTEVHMKLQSTLDQKEDEINRYKEGYDAKIFHKFLLRFTGVDQAFKDYIRDDRANKDVKDILENIGEVMEDALAECGVESFSPKVGDDYRSVEGVADNPKKFDTSNEGEHYLIKEIIDEGYRRETDGKGYKIITEAKVSIYIYRKPEEGSNTIQG